MEPVPDNADIPALSEPVFLRTQDSPAPAPIDRVQDETGDPTPTKNPATLDAGMGTKSIVEPVRAGDNGPRNLVSLLDSPTPLLHVLVSWCPLLPLDPAFQDVVHLASADDLFITGIEDGRVEEKWLTLPTTEPAVVANQLFERRHLAGDGINAADHQDVRHVGELRFTPEMPRCVRAK